MMDECPLVVDLKIPFFVVPAGNRPVKLFILHLRRRASRGGGVWYFVTIVLEPQFCGQQMSGRDLKIILLQEAVLVESIVIPFLSSDRKDIVVGVREIV